MNYPDFTVPGGEGGGYINMYPGNGTLRGFQAQLAPGVRRKTPSLAELTEVIGLPTTPAPDPPDPGRSPGNPLPSPEGACLGPDTGGEDGIGGGRTPHAGMPGSMARGRPPFQAKDQGQLSWSPSDQLFSALGNVAEGWLASGYRPAGAGLGSRQTQRRYDSALAGLLQAY